MADVVCMKNIRKAHVLLSMVLNFINNSKNVTFEMKCSAAKTVGFIMKMVLKCSNFDSLSVKMYIGCKNMRKNILSYFMPKEFVGSV